MSDIIGNLTSGLVGSGVGGILAYVAAFQAAKMQVRAIQAQIDIMRDEISDHRKKVRADFIIGVFRESCG